MYNVICVKFGTKYNSQYVNKLYHDIKAVAKSDFKFYCYTDDKIGIDKEIIIIDPLPKPTLKGVWNKLRLFDPDMPFKSGHNIYIDLDTYVSDCIFTRLADHDWNTLHVCGAPWKNDKQRYGRLSN